MPPQRGSALALPPHPVPLTSPTAQSTPSGEEDPHGEPPAWDDCHKDPPKGRGEAGGAGGGGVSPHLPQMGHILGRGEAQLALSHPGVPPGSRGCCPSGRWGCGCSTRWPCLSAGRATVLELLLRAGQDAGAAAGGCQPPAAAGAGVPAGSALRPHLPSHQHRGPPLHLQLREPLARGACGMGGLGQVGGARVGCGRCQ